MTRLAKTNYAVRTAAFLYALVVLALHFWDKGYPPIAWVALVLQFAVYPHVLYWRSMHSADPRRAELDNLFIDAVLLGAWIAALGFPNWITFGLTGALLLNSAVNRGWQGALIALTCACTGAALALAVVGFEYRPLASKIVVVLCFFGSLGYIVTVGLVSHWQNRALAEAGEALRAEQGRYRFIAENAADLIALVDADGRWLYTSPSYARLLDPVDLEQGADAFRSVHPDDADRAHFAVLKLRSDAKPRELPVRLVDRQGRIRHYRMRVQPFGNEQPPKTIMLVSHDVTDILENEEKLLLAAHALEGMAEAIAIVSAEGLIVTVNRAFTEITGYARDEVVGTPEKSIRNALQPAEFYDEVYAAVERQGYWSGTTWARRKDGSVYREWRSVRAIRDASGAKTHTVMVFSEVGSKKGFSEEPGAA